MINACQSPDDWVCRPNTAEAALQASAQEGLALYADELAQACRCTIVGILSNMTDLNILITLFLLPENSCLHRHKSAAKLRSTEDPCDGSHLTWVLTQL